MPSISEPLIRTINHGATWTHFHVPVSDDGQVQDILLSFPDDKLYATHEHPYFGNTIGRIANRIADGKIPDVNGQDWQVSINEGSAGQGNCLHGGHQGWGAKVWSSPDDITHGTWDAGIKNLDSGIEKRGIVYTLTSPDGDEGFPGTICAKTMYFEGRGPKGEVVLDIEYEAELVDDSVKATVISMTNHAYFNLNGATSDAKNREEEWTLDAHTVTLPTSSYLKLRDYKPGIPTGEISTHPLVAANPDTPFSLTDESGATKSIDDCFVLPEYITTEAQADIPIDTRSRELQTLATIKGERSGIVLRVQSTEPAFQLYTGKFTDVSAYPGGMGYGPFSGLCVEPSRFVDAAGRREWQGQVLLKKGQLFGAKNRYWAWKE